MFHIFHTKRLLQHQTLSILTYTMTKKTTVQLNNILQYGYFIYKNRSKIKTKDHRRHRHLVNYRD